MAKNKQGLFGKLQSWFSSSAEAEEERVESADPPAASRRRRAPAARAEPDDPNASPEERLLRGTGLFSTFDSAELQGVCQSLTVVQHAAGERILEEGAIGDAFYVIRHGVVRVSTLDENGREIVLARLEDGRYFGDQALLDETPGPRNASLTAVTDVDLLRLGYADFQRLVQSNSKMAETLRERGGKQFVENWAKRRSVFRALDNKLLEGLFRNVREFAPDTVIFAHGDVGDGVYFITEGEVRIIIGAKGGKSPVETRMVAGQMFGELATLGDTRRTASAVAGGSSPVRALFFDKKQFLKLYAASPDLKGWMNDVQSIYQIHDRGLVSIHNGDYLNMECVTSVFQLEDGRSVTASKVRGQQIFVLAEAGAPEGRVVHWEKDGLRRELSIAGGRIVAVVCSGFWPELGKVCAMALDAEPLEEWRESLFRTAGTLQVVEPDDGTDPNALLCNCMRVPRGRVRQAIDGGHTNLETVSATTGAGSVCGTCRPKITAMLGNTSWEPVRVEEIIERSSGVRSYRLRPFTGGLQPYAPGQHIVIQSLIDERFVARTYTLTSVATTEHYEITVKREPEGYFSNWLFSNDGQRPFLRISPPAGSGIHTLLGQGPIVCLVAGIGVTPALALARELAAADSDQRLHIEYSSRTRGDLVFADELQAIAGRRPNVSLATRVTSEAGRLTAKHIAEIAVAHPGASFFVCGPPAFNTAVSAALKSAGVQPARVLSEEFTHAGGPVLR